MDQSKIEVRGLRYGAGGAEILAGVDALVPDGEVTAVVGPSGAGKSTLLRAINRLIEPTSGEVYLDGEPTGSLDPLELRRRVGMVFQIPALFGDSVEDAVLYGARLAGRSADPGRLLEVVGLDVSLAGRDPQSLSVGQQQRVAIARALALEPEALLLDEPTSALDEAARRKVEAALALGATGRQAASPILKTPSLGHWHWRVEERRDYRKQQIGAVHNRHVRSAGEHREL